MHSPPTRVTGGRRRSPATVYACLLAAIVTAFATAVAWTAPASAASVDTNGWYVLVNRNSGKVLDVSGFSTADGGSLVQWARTNGNNQQWRFVDSGGGYYRVLSRHSGKVLDVYNFSTADAADIVQWSDHNGTNQQFRLADSSDGYVRLINRNSGKAVEVQNASTADGGRIVQYSDWGGNNQQWQFVRVGNVSETSPSPSPSPSVSPPVSPSPSPSPSPGGPWPPSSTYTNPVLWDDLADIDIFRAGDTYYYSASTMHYSP
ncbi:RICIN domain-containing protein, partial [Microbispora sp. H11081]|uniref:RICIN domain-containing protein n=1 Tax=Microbispora sp. H11081 TaxID=2729107 RepID=UPI001473F210